jgi:Na+/serine symporter
MAILKQYLVLCWFRNNPLELPRSVAFFKQNLLFYFIIEYFMQANMIDDPVESFAEVSIVTLITLLFIGIMLFFNKTLYAYIQVTTAILFCANIVAFFIVPVIIWLTVSEDPLSYYFFALLLLWDYAMITYIIRRTLSINIPASIVLSLFYFTATYFVAFALGQLL